jgi:hypothetical protein
VGYWTIYDEKDPSKILIKRLYRSHLEFEQLLPNHSSSKIIPFVTKNMNPTLGLNDDGYKEYAYVTSADFIFSSRLYREILFEKNNIPFNEIIELLKRKLSFTTLPISGQFAKIIRLKTLQVILSVLESKKTSFLIKIANFLKLELSD